MLLSVLTGLFGVLLLIGIIIKFIWWILGAVALVVCLLHRAVRRALVRRTSRRRSALPRWSSRPADQQHNWVMRGDERGIYRTEGAKLMHYLYRNGRHG